MMDLTPDLTTETGRKWAEMIAASKHKRGQVQHTRGVMNGTEGLYASQLSLQMLDGSILGYYFERFKLVLDAPEDGRAVTYMPDFLVMHREGFSLDEVKGGFIREDAALKFRWACEQFPLLWFRMFQYDGGRFHLLRERKPKL